MTTASEGRERRKVMRSIKGGRKRNAQIPRLTKQGCSLACPLELAAITGDGESHRRRDGVDVELTEEGEEVGIGGRVADDLAMSIDQADAKER
jgi:hypothetical protein